MLVPYYKKENFELFQGDSLELLRNLSSSFDMIFADPPYFLSTGNGMININGQFIRFDKGQWDRVRFKCKGRGKKLHRQYLLMGILKPNFTTVPS